MSRRRDLPAGWRQPPETTAEPVPLRRPYLPSRTLPAVDLAPLPPLPPSPPRFFTRRRPAAAGQAAPAAGQAAPAAAPLGTSNTIAAPPVRRPPAMRRWRPMRAIIGDEVRVPILWCEFGSCIARYTSREVIDERDLRARALAAGWCYDALGRLACPSCVRHDSSFRVGRPPAPASQYLRRR
jgi:hypothetical protein